VREPVSFADVIEETQGIMAYTKEMTKDLSEIVAKINRGSGTIGKLLNDEELYYATTEITKTASTNLDSITYDLRYLVGIYKEMSGGMNDIIVKVNDAIGSVDTIIANIKQGRGVIGSLLVEGSPEDTTLTEIIENIRNITDEAKIATTKLNENMEALIDRKTEELNEKIKLLEEKIDELKSLEASSK